MRTVDLVGVGAGPANLALAAALDEHNRLDEQRRIGGPLAMTVFEREVDFGWHPDMLLEGATMQIAFLKDLVTLRNPQSPFSFLAYLKDRGRIVDFVNQQTFFPTRVEFTDYLRWISERVDSTILYGTEVMGLTRLTRQPDGARFAVHVSGPDGRRTVHARSVVVAAGLSQRLPRWATRGPRLFHNHELLTRLEALPRHPEPDRFLVVGGGQSAAEVARHLHTTFRSAIVECAFNGYGFQPADDSPYANRVFDPDAVDDFYNAPPEIRAELMMRHSTTNYACVDLDLINELYAIEYREKVVGRRRLYMLPATAVLDACADEDGVAVTLRSRLTGVLDERRYTAVVCATGFESVGAEKLLEVSGAVPSGSTVDRQYRQVIDGEAIPGLYVQGATEATHGLASTLLSNAAVRAGEILSTLIGDLRGCEGCDDSEDRAGSAAASSRETAGTR
ncbi:lysine N(6)-hydroxylase/L-ornithine N(5)-oxygenase family protein [Gordonia shandongensis]|uniref:lysine N(6)-hydroxylase/L-ornithine N(5)-oxygenase family protein n=1 Tax=Gordonia shandongensis TaxID=376351 RepID=UPI00047AAD33